MKSTKCILRIHRKRLNLQLLADIELCLLPNLGTVDLIGCIVVNREMKFSNLKVNPDEIEDYRITTLKSSFPILNGLYERSTLRSFWVLVSMGCRKPSYLLNSEVACFHVNHLILYVVYISLLTWNHQETWILWLDSPRIPIHELFNHGLLNMPALFGLPNHVESQW